MHDIVGGEPHDFHFERSPDERTYALGIVVANGFAKVVGVGTITVFALLGLGFGIDAFQGSLDLRTDAWTKTCHGAALGQRDGFVLIHANKVVDDSAIGLDASFAIFCAKIAFAIGL